MKNEGLSKGSEAKWAQNVTKFGAHHMEALFTSWKARSPNNTMLQGETNNTSIYNIKVWFFNPQIRRYLTDKCHLYELFHE